MRKIRNFFSKVVVVTVCSGLVASLTPISGVFADEITLTRESSAEETLLAEESMSIPADEATSVESTEAPEAAPVEPAETPANETAPVESVEDSEAVPLESIKDPEAEPTDVPEVASQPTDVPEVASESAETPEATSEPAEVHEDETALENPVSEMVPVEEAQYETPLVEEAPVGMSVSSDEALKSASAVSADKVDKAFFASNEQADFAEAIGLNRVATMSVQSQTQSVTYYAQPAFYTNTNYDCVSVYLTNESGEYAQRTFIVTDGAEWLLYDYGETMAKEFFAQTELKDGRYIPVQKATSRKDNSKTTGIDESKIPTMTQAKFLEMVYDWRTLENVPFTRTAAGVIIYAGTGKEDDSDNPTPAPTPDNTQNQHVLTINSSTYDVRVTKSVLYNGRKHVSKNAKNSKTQVNDLDIQVYRNGSLVEPKYYTLKYANNTNVNGYGKATNVPYFTVTLKNVAPYKKDRAQLAKNKFGFTIVPADIAKVGFSLKKVRVTGTTKIALGTPTAKIDGVTLKLSAQGAKNPLTGAFKASYADGIITIYGVNNYAGKATINLLSAKTMDYIF